MLRVRRIRPPWSYAVAAAVTAIAVACRLALLPTQTPILIFFVLPVAIAARVGGLGPGLLATAMALLASRYWLVAPLHSLSLSATSNLVNLVLLAVTGAVVAWVTDSAYRTGRRIESAERESADATREAEARGATALRQSEERYRAMFADAAVGIVELDAGDRIVAANGRFCDMLGYSWDELRGRTIHDITAPEDAERTRDLNAKGHRGELRTFQYEKRYVRRDGSRVWAHVNVSVVRDEAGSFVRAIGTAADITDRKVAEQALARANERLREVDRRKDEFLGMLSHELRNPLAPIRNSTYILRRADPASPQFTRARAVIERQAEHLARLVDDLLDVTRIARGKILLHRDRVDLCDVVARAVEDARGAIESRGVTVLAVVPPTRLWADADATRITQILGNLLANARKFTHPGDEVSVALREVDAMAELSVRDTGAGIDPELLPNLFDAFVQGKRTLARSEGGLGLGLALVRGLTELHGGSVRASSDGQGRGSAFVVTLPLVGPLVDEQPPHDAPHCTVPRRHVLVVDDNADAADSLAEVVGLFGHEVEVAYDGPSAIEKVRLRRPDVVLCDIGLPGMTGYDVARALRRELDGPVRLVAVSGYAQVEDVEKARAAGFDEHLAKPAGPSQLERLLS